MMGAAVRAALTVTFGFAKYGHVSYPGAGYCGDLKIVDIGFPPAAVEDVMATGTIPGKRGRPSAGAVRVPGFSQGNFGHPLIIAGGLGKGGAALLASRAALRTGAGLVTAAIPACVAAVVAAGQAELMTEPMPDVNGHFAANSDDRAPARACRAQDRAGGRTRDRRQRGYQGV